jgi:hypothetical protein
MHRQDFGTFRISICVDLDAPARPRRARIRATGPEQASIRQIGQGRDTSTAKLAKLQETLVEAHNALKEMLPIKNITIL